MTCCSFIFLGLSSAARQISINIQLWTKRNSVAEGSSKVASVVGAHCFTRFKLAKYCRQVSGSRNDVLVWNYKTFHQSQTFTVIRGTTCSVLPTQGFKQNVGLYFQRRSTQARWLAHLPYALQCLILLPKHPMYGLPYNWHFTFCIKGLLRDICKMRNHSVAVHCIVRVTSYSAYGTTLLSSRLQLQYNIPFFFSKQSRRTSCWRKSPTRIEKVRGTDWTL